MVQLPHSAPLWVLSSWATEETLPSKCKWRYKSETRAPGGFPRNKGPSKSPALRTRKAGGGRENKAAREREAERKPRGLLGFPEAPGQAAGSSWLLSRSPNVNSPLLDEASSGRFLCQRLEG